jgi:hypothetical protein
LLILEVFQPEEPETEEKGEKEEPAGKSVYINWPEAGEKENQPADEAQAEKNQE